MKIIEAMKESIRFNVEGYSQEEWREFVEWLMAKLGIEEDEKCESCERLTKDQVNNFDDEINRLDKELDEKQKEIRGLNEEIIDMKGSI